MKYYNIWYRPSKRWTLEVCPLSLNIKNHRNNKIISNDWQSLSEPFLLSCEDVEKWLNHILMGSVSSIYEIREVITSQIVVSNINDTNIAINDYTCLSCKNDRCSKTEKSCWRCGNIF